MRVVKTKLLALCERLNFPLNALYKIDGSKRSAHSQAYFFGIFKKKQIVVYDTLIDSAEPDEVVAVVGHELGHWHHMHNVAMLIFQLLFIGVFLSLLGLIMENEKFYYDFGFSNKFYFAGIIMFGLFFQPVNIVLTALICAVVRRNEFQADRFAVGLGMGKQLRSGLLKILKENKADVDPDPLYALFNHTHPHLTVRIAAMDIEIAKQQDKLK